MSATTVDLDLDAPAARLPEVERTKARPVLWWAAIGVFFAGFVIYVQGSWILTDAHRIHTGPTPVPTYMKASALALQILLAVFFVTMLYRVVVRPLRRDGRLSFDGLLFLALVFVWWQDPLFNYVTNGFEYNSVLFNLGGWANHIPGWNAPNGNRIAEPLIGVLTIYIAFACGASIVGSKLLRKIQARRPQLGTPTLFAGLFLAFALMDIVLEFSFVRLGLYAAGGTADGWNFFPSRFYRFPVYEPILVSLVFCGWTAIRYFRDDKGQTLAERGIDRVRAGAKQKTWIRFFALVGMVNLVLLFGYSIPVQLWQLHAGAWPRSIQERSYLTNGLCGAGTTYACTGSGVPIPQSGTSLHVAPNGQLVTPAGTQVPRQIPFLTR
jgi:hypothetical protein